jgi:hypothetical protein
LPAEPVWFCLERICDRVSAFFSTEGERWFTVGSVEFPVTDPLEVGVHAIGRINRAYYPGAYREGTVIRFASFQLTHRRENREENRCWKPVDGETIQINREIYGYRLETHARQAVERREQRGRDTLE